MPRRAAAGTPPPYSFVEVPDAAKRPMLGDSMVEAPATRQRWLGMKEELKGLCDEAVRRRALKLLSRGARPRTALASAGAPLYEAYIADRLDLDDPLDGLVVRHRVTGWLQGFVTRTTFTTWTPHFMWDSRHHAAGLKGLVGSGRKLDSGVSRGARASPKPPRAGGAGALLKRACKVTAPPTNDPHLLPGESLAEALERQPHGGNWRTTGIVWEKVAEVSLLAALGCGDWLMGVLLEELAGDPRYEFCVVASTPGAATFYERHGFVRVGAIARYLDPEVDDVDSPHAPAKPWQAYRHWAWGDERRESLRDNHGEPSYMMARRVARHTGDDLRAANAVLRQRDQRMSVPRPRVQPSANPTHAPSYNDSDYFTPPPTGIGAPRSPSPSPPPPPAPRSHKAAKPAARKPSLPRAAKPVALKPAAKPAAKPAKRKTPDTKPAKPASHKKKPRAKISNAKPPRRQAALAAKDSLRDDAKRGKT